MSTWNMIGFEVIKHNKQQYADYVKKIQEMNGLEKIVAENLVLVWIKGRSWLGGISDSSYEKISNTITTQYGYSFMEIYDEFERQLANLSWE